MLRKSPPQPEPLEDRILAFHAELDRYIESRLDDLQKEAPGVPRVVLRNLVEARAPNCACAQSLELLRT
jgi:hypothetical protein